MKSRYMMMQQRRRGFFFEFVLRVIVVIWTDLSESDVKKTYSSVSKFLSISENEAQAIIMELRKNLPLHSVPDTKNFVREQVINLLLEICFNYVSESAHTYGEEMSEIPQSLNFSEEISLYILEHVKSTDRKQNEALSHKRPGLLDEQTERLPVLHIT